MKTLSKDVAEIHVSYLPKSSIRPFIGSSKDAYDQMIKFFPVESLALQERFLVGYLSRSNSLLGVYEASVGGITGTVADPRLILSVALKTASVGIVLAHNHPSGNLKPSKQDIDLTNRLKEAASLMDINVIDHLIVTAEEGSYLSFADEGLL